MTPPHAPQIYLSADKLHLVFTNLQGLVHGIILPATLESFDSILAILRANNAQSKIGSPGAPTQYQIEKDLSQRAKDFISSGGKIKSEWKPAFAEDIKDVTKDILRKMGLI